MSNKNFIIYRSSAGSGKTYTLAKEYLALALQNPHYYRHILAVTFTNKAMQEMKNRIISKLNEFAQGKTDAMAEELMEQTGYPPDLFRQKSTAVLSNILHGYSHFAVSTIDTFFQKVIRGFSKELGLSGNARLELDTAPILTQIVSDLLVEIEENEALRQWLISFTLDKLEEGKGWDIQRALENFAKEMFNEEFQAFEADIQAKSTEAITDFLIKLNTIIQAFEQTMKAYGHEGHRIMEAHNLTPDDFLYKKAGVINYLNKIIAGEDYKPGTRVYNALQEDKWYNAKAPNAHAIATALESGLRQQIADAVAHYEKICRRYTTAVAIRKFIYGYGLLADLSRKLTDYKADHDVMLISDATRFLRELVRDTDTPFVYEKIGSFFQHYLIDEFQDTSHFQWDSFRPLIENSLSEGKRNIIVGDAKQSIYRWRGGDPALLEKEIERDIGKAHTTVDTLDTNYRSEAQIVHFNNDFFAGMYKDEKQRISPGKQKDEKGYVRVAFLANDSEDPWKAKVNREIPLLIEQLQDKGVPLKEIAILVRENKEGQEIANVLLEYEHSPEAKPSYRYDVVSNESLFLSGSAAVSTLIAALRYLENPGNGINKAELLYNFQRKIKGNIAVDINSLFMSVSTHAFAEGLPENFVVSRTQLLHLPLYELIDHLIHTFGLGEMVSQFAFLQTFQDMVLKFIQQEKGDVHSFLRWWDDRGHKKSIKAPDDLDAIRILTIHKAKGLEFHSVIAPYCAWGTDHKPNQMIWCDTEEAPFNEGKLPVAYATSLANTFFADQYEQEKAKAWMDSINALYVAFTRAAHDLWVFTTEAEIRKGHHVGKVIGETLRKDNMRGQWHETGGGNIYEQGSATFTFQKEENPAVNRMALTTYRHYNWRDKMAIRKTANTMDTADERRLKINYGILVHKVLAQVKTHSDLGKALATISWETSLNTEQATALKNHLLQLFQQETVKGWFTPSWLVRNEASILTAEDEYRPDRVMTQGKKAVIVDYKTGLKKGRDIQQMKTYMALLTKMGYTPVIGYLWYIDINVIDEIHGS